MEKPLKAVPWGARQSCHCQQSCIIWAWLLGSLTGPKAQQGPKDTAPSCLQPNFQSRSDLRLALTALKCHHFYSGPCFQLLSPLPQPCPTKPAHHEGKQGMNWFSASPPHLHMHDCILGALIRGLITGSTNPRREEAVIGRCWPGWLLYAKMWTIVPASSASTHPFRSTSYASSSVKPSTSGAL